MKGFENLEGQLGFDIRVRKNRNYQGIKSQYFFILDYLIIIGLGCYERIKEAESDRKRKVKTI
jgi:hypothetical protein